MYLCFLMVNNNTNINNNNNINTEPSNESKGYILLPYMLGLCESI